MVFAFPSYMTSDFLEMTEHLPVHGKWWMYSLLYFSLLIKLSFSQTISFLIFTLGIFSTIPVRRRWESVCGAFWLWLNHYKLYKKLKKINILYWSQLQAAENLKSENLFFFISEYKIFSEHFKNRVDKAT